MQKVFIVDFLRTPIGKYGGALSSIRTDDLATKPLQELLKRYDNLDKVCDEIVFGCANQAGEDNRNVARMASLLAGFPATIPAFTVNRLCASGMDAVISAYRSIAVGDNDVVIAGGVENMSRAPFVIPKSTSAFSRQASIADTTIGWRLVNSKMQELYGVDSMPETAENVASQYNVSREDQDRFALRSQTNYAKSIDKLQEEIIPVEIPQRKKDAIVFSQDEHPRETNLEKLSLLPTPFREGGTVTAGNASGVNDGAAAMVLASEEAIKNNNWDAIAQIVGGASAGVLPKVMGVGPVPAVNKLCKQQKLSIEEFDVIELNEAFAAQALAVLRELNIQDDDERINPNGGAIALGHPLGMSGLRITGTCALELKRRNDKLGLATMCVGVGQGVAVAITR